MSVDTDSRSIGQESRRDRASLVFVIFILLLGVCAVFLHQRTPDFGGDDVFYADAAQSLLQRGVYEVDGKAETTQPPGLAAILAAVFAMFGYSYGVCVMAMALFETVGFLAAFELLKRRVGIVIGGTICVVLMSSPVYFAWATRLVYACFPCFFVTMVALLCGEEYERASTFRSELVWGVAFTVAIVASLLLATATIAVLGAMVMVVLATVLKDRRMARTRLLKFLPVLLVGILVQGLWMHRQPAPSEWPLPGYPAPYLDQVKVKDGNHPELGMATWQDIPGRVTSNALAAADSLSRLLLRHGINQTRVAVLMIPVLLVAAGWAYSVWASAGADLVAWYFAGYALVYLLWPWRMELRFVLPIAPLACLYAWRGMTAIRLTSDASPRLVGILWASMALGVAAVGAHSISVPRRTGHGDLPDQLAIAMWLVSAGGALWMARSGKSLLSADLPSRMGNWLNASASPGRVTRHQLVVGAGGVLAAVVIGLGIAVDGRIARENLGRTDLASAEKVGIGEVLPAEVSAGIWLRSHTDPGSIVMARHWPTVHHHANRRSVWFPPISDPGVLFEGIVKHGVDYIVVVNHPHPYYLPDDGYCFDRLLTIRPATLTLAMQSGDLQIFKVQRVPYAGLPG
jgi:hypothetical protein